MTVLTLTEAPPTSRNLPHTQPQPSTSPTMGSSLPDPEHTSKIPALELDVEIITDVIVARLATSLLGHILFLKSQVPFPIQQLARIPGNSKNSRTAKLRADLVSSYDTISSHFISTFSSLSTAFARVSPGESRRERAYLAILVGPSIGIAKSKVVMIVDGFEAKVWGQRVLEGVEDSHNDSEDESDENSEDSYDEDSEGSECSEASEEHPPLSRSPSPETPESLPASPSSPYATPPPPSVQPCGPITHYGTQDQEQVIRAADRLLSRKLAQAQVDGTGMDAEMSPTQTHVLIRAPRRFSHPAWIPQQNFTASLNSTIKQFVQETTMPSLSQTTKPKKRAHKIEGVWIGCRGGPSDEEKKDLQEQDEMIWWSWDGKFVGFADW